VGVAYNAAMKLRHWYVVFGTNGECPQPAALAEALRPRVAGLVVEFPPELSWKKGTLKFPTQTVGNSSTPFTPSIWVSRYAENLEELTSHPLKWVSESPDWGLPADRDMILNHLRQTVQAITLKPMAYTASARMARVCEQLCGHLCRIMNGLIQVHQEGFFDAAGQSIYPRNDVHRLKTK
jgi:hypothetical protein